jgi:hypothetical protein
MSSWHGLQTQGQLNIYLVYMLRMNGLLFSRPLYACMNTLRGMWWYLIVYIKFGERWQEDVILCYKMYSSACAVSNSD